ncbi:hypothetical protein GW17_00050734 [Ensete ventricosum]|nr:hypothetical protein GW17_00050734 [Ensete ventricosum]
MAYEGNEEGRLATARPRPRPARKGRPSAGTATRKGGAYGHDRLRPTHKGGNRPQRGARKGSGCRAACASGGRQRPAHEGLSPAATNGQAARGGCPWYTCKGGGRQRPARKGLPPAACAGAATATA